MPVPSLPNRDQTRVEPEVKQVRIQSPAYKGVTVDTTLVSLDVLTTFLSGSAWDVDYYNQLLGKDDAQAAFQQDLHAVYQQYKLIRGMEMKVTAELSKGQDDDKNTLLSGTAKVYAILIPKEGDFFLADIGDGREGLFTVTSVTQLSHYESSPFEISYELTRLTDETVRKSYEPKVQQVQIFDKHWMQSGLEPLINEDDVDIINKLEAHYNRLMSIYFNDFYSRTHKSLLVPNQHRLTYDPFLVRFLKTILSTDEHPVIRHIVEFNVSEDQAMYEFTIWNCLSAMDYNMLPMCVHEAGIVDVGNFFSRPVYNSIYYSGVQAVVYPEMAPTNVDAGYDGFVYPVLDHVHRGRARFMELDRLVQKQTLDMDPTFEIYEATGKDASPAIRRVTQDNYYVFSEAFYKHTGHTVLSQLEVLTMAALKGEPVDIRVLDKLCEGAKFWDNVERFYFIPVLFALLHVYPRRIK